MASAWVQWAMRRVDGRQLQQERLALGSERLERGASPTAMQGRVMHPHDDRGHGRRIAQVHQRVKRGSPHIRMGIVERGDELSRMVPGLNKPERAQPERAAPPPPSAPQVAVGTLETRQCKDRARRLDALRVGVLDGRRNQHPRDREPVSRGTCRESPSCGVVALKRPAYEWAVMRHEAATSRLLYADGRALHDHGSSRGEGEQHRTTGQGARDG
jgi:hypothetical protein